LSTTLATAPSTVSSTDILSLPQPGETIIAGLGSDQEEGQ
jgi:hypothetical protein